MTPEITPNSNQPPEQGSPAADTRSTFDKLVTPLLAFFLNDITPQAPADTPAINPPDMDDDDDPPIGSWMEKFRSGGFLVFGLIAFCVSSYSFLLSRYNDYMSFMRHTSMTAAQKSVIDMRAAVGTPAAQMHGVRADGIRQEIVTALSFSLGDRSSFEDAQNAFTAGGWARFITAMRQNGMIDADNAPNATQDVAITAGPALYSYYGMSGAHIAVRLEKTVVDKMTGNKSATAQICDIKLAPASNTRSIDAAVPLDHITCYDDK